jgi:hypothetical protein
MGRKPGKRAPKKAKALTDTIPREKPDEVDVAYSTTVEVGTALEELHASLRRIEALSEAAVRSLEFWPRAKTSRGSRALGHTYDLVMLLDGEVAEAMAIGTKAVKQLSRQLKRHGK